jgi:hypothetical protein
VFAKVGGDARKLCSPGDSGFTVLEALSLQREPQGKARLGNDFAPISPNCGGSLVRIPRPRWAALRAVSFSDFSTTLTSQRVPKTCDSAADFGAVKRLDIFSANTPFVGLFFRNRLRSNEKSRRVLADQNSKPFVSGRSVRLRFNVCLRPPNPVCRAICFPDFSTSKVAAGFCW